MFHKSVFNPTVYFLMLIYMLGCSGCGSSSSDKDFTPRVGKWTGEGISFSVSDDISKITDISLTYDGTASGQYCSYSFITIVNLPEIEILDNNFEYFSTEHEVSGSFIDEKTAEVELFYEQYNSNCDAYYSDSKTFIATFSENSAND